MEAVGLLGDEKEFCVSFVYENWLEVRNGKLEHSPSCDRRLTVMLEPFEDADGHAYLCFWRENSPPHFASKTLKALAKLSVCPACGEDLPEVMAFYGGGNVRVFHAAESYAEYRVRETAGGRATPASRPRPLRLGAWTTSSRRCARPARRLRRKRAGALCYCSSLSTVTRTRPRSV